jgi:hypothetical protein
VFELGALNKSGSETTLNFWAFFELNPNNPLAKTQVGGGMRSWAVQAAIILAITIWLTGCGGKSSSGKTVNSAVVQVTLGPASTPSSSTISLVAGQVTQLSFSALNANGSPATPTPTFTFNTSNPKLATVGMSGGLALVCGGVFDSSAIVCNGNDSSGKPLIGTATLTASAGGVTSAPVQVTVHPAITSIQVTQTSGNVFPGCTSNTQTAQFKAQAFNGSTDITSLVGNFTFLSSLATVARVDINTGLVTSANPGLTGIVATSGTVSSPTANFKSCLPAKIVLHLNGDPAGQPTESATINLNDTTTNNKTIQADMVDENNTTVASVTGLGIAISSNNTQVATGSGGTLTGTLTGASPGGAGLVAVCAPPNCGGGLVATPIYSNLFSVTVTGASPATTVYATSSFPPPTSSPTPTILPIDTSKTPPAAGTAINLPCPNGPCAVPNSMVFNPTGSRAFLGTSQGLASLDPNANSVTLLDPFVGKVLAVSPDGNTAIESNAANDPSTGTPIQPDPASQRVVVFSNNTAQTFVAPGATAAAFTSDGSKAYISANNGNFYVFSPLVPFRTFSLGGSNTGVAFLASSPFAFFANSAGLEVVSTCNNTQLPTANNPPTHSSSISTVQSFKNSDTFVALDTTGINIETATVTAPTAPINITQSNCAPNVSFSNQFVDFGVGAFTANQLLVPTNGLGVGGDLNNGSHIVVLPAGQAQLFVANPVGGVTAYPLKTGTEALNGGLTLDGNVAWLGVAGTNDVHEVILTNSPSTADAVQIPTSFKKSDGSAAPPNIVAIRPK